LSPIPPRSAREDEPLQAVLHAPLANVDDARDKRLRLDQLQVDPLFQGREVMRAPAQYDRTDEVEANIHRLAELYEAVAG